MHHFVFQIITPEALIFEGNCWEVELPGTEGRFGVLMKHMNMVSSLKPGIVMVHSAEGGKMMKFAISDGFADVTPERCTVLVEMAVAQDKVNVEAAKRRLDELNKLVKQDESCFVKDEHTHEIHYLECVLSLHHKH